MNNFYIELGCNGYSFEQVSGYKISDLLSELGISYDPNENDADTLNAEIFAMSGNLYGANCYGISGLCEIAETTIGRKQNGGKHDDK